MMKTGRSMHSRHNGKYHNGDIHALSLRDEKPNFFHCLIISGLTRIYVFTAELLTVAARRKIPLLRMNRFGSHRLHSAERLCLPVCSAESRRLSLRWHKRGHNLCDSDKKKTLDKNFLPNR